MSFFARCQSGTIELSVSFSVYVSYSGLSESLVSSFIRDFSISSLIG